jgi:hypothetical protein
MQAASLGLAPKRGQVRFQSLLFRKCKELFPLMITFPEVDQQTYADNCY